MIVTPLKTLSYASGRPEIVEGNEMTTKYKVLDVRMANNDAVKVGDFVYSTKGHDYGLSSDDTRHTGIEHMSVSLKEDGDYPLFTIPVKALQKVES